jgi:hypothetical protein
MKEKEINFSRRLINGARRINDRRVLTWMIKDIKIKELW